MTMKVLLLGATGNLGSRLVPALLTHGSNVVAYVRSPAKLDSLLPKSVYEQVTIAQGDAMDSAAIKKAILDNKCDAVVSAAGVAAMAPWGKSDLPKIFRAVVDAVREAGEERKQPLRAWLLAGMSILSYPGTDLECASFIPVYTEHRQDLAVLKSLPPNSVEWSLLCPATMIPESTDLSVPTKATQGGLVGAAGTLPLWKNSWLESVPLIGRTLHLAMSFGGYTTTLEQCAEFIASDLESPKSEWVGKTVGIIKREQ